MQVSLCVKLDHELNGYVACTTFIIVQRHAGQLLKAALYWLKWKCELKIDITFDRPLLGFRKRKKDESELT